MAADHEVAQEHDRCPVCGRPSSESEQDAWIFLEVTRYAQDGRPGWTSESFCSQAHAAEWLGVSLPPLEPVTFSSPTARDRLQDLGAMVLLGLPIILAGVGIYAIGDWLGVYE